MRARAVVAAIACGLLVGGGVGCSRDGAAPDTGDPSAAAPPAPPVVSPDKLDAGRYPTTPRESLGVARDAFAGSILQAQQLADHVIGPWQVDETLVAPYLDSYVLLDAPTSLARLGPEQLSRAAARHQFVNGFASARQAPDQAAMVNAVLRFPDPAAAAAAATDLNDVAMQTPIMGTTPTKAAIPGHPEAAASTYPYALREGDRPWTAVRSFAPHGPYVLMQFVQASAGLDAATALVGKAIDAQGRAIDEFTPVDVTAFAEVPVDPTGLLAKTLPLAGGAIAVAKNAVYDANGAAHFQSNPIASNTLFDDAGVTAVAMAQTNVYEAKDPAAARLIVDSFHQELTEADGTTDTAPVRNLPESHCVALARGFYCVAPADRYAIEAKGEQFADVQQQVAAQYVMLTAGD